MIPPSLNLLWLRRDLRLEDNTALFQALWADIPVLPVFIFDPNILRELPPDDARVSFIYDQLAKLNQQLQAFNSSLLILHGDPVDVIQKLLIEFPIQSIYINQDYEPYALERDKKIQILIEKNNRKFLSFKDQVIFEPHEILKNDGTPYTIFTPFANRWKEAFSLNPQKPNLYNLNEVKFVQHSFNFPDRSELHQKSSSIKVKDYTFEFLPNYENIRNIPAIDGGSYLSPHLRFGTISIRLALEKALQFPSFLNELIWREFFMMILFHFPQVLNHSFKAKYDQIQWRNNEEEFEKWCQGKTGYPMVDAGMRELNSTGYMHNRVRMVTASFLTKHLLIDWRWGEAYFAQKLLDYELSSNNGNWQWAAGTGCDAAPYFRIFNPGEQLKKFDPQLFYCKKWIPELITFSYPKPMVDHSFARQRALESYKKGIESVL